MINFRFKERHTNVKTEIDAGVVTFITMSYILFVNAGMLANAGMPFKGVLVATALSAGITTIIMGVFTNTPIALAPGMGLNAFFTFSVVKGMGFRWDQALAIVFVSGAFFAFLALFNVKKLVIDAIPKGVKHAISVGIGGFIAFIGLKNAGIIVDNPATLVGLGKIMDPAVMITLFFTILLFIFHVRKVKGAILLAMLLASVTGIIIQKLGISSSIKFALPQIPSNILSTDFSDFKAIFGQVFKNIGWVFSQPKALIALFIFMFVDVFDTVATMIPIIGEVKNHDKKDHINEKRILGVDAFGTMLGAVLGTSTVTAYIESLAGVEEGGRTGLTSIVVGTLFLLSAFFAPVTQLFSTSVTSIALIFVGALMFSNVRNINWLDTPTAFAAFACVLGMILTFAIYWGIVAAFVIYPIVKAFDKKSKDVSKAEITLAIIAIAFTFIYFM